MITPQLQANSISKEKADISITSVADKHSLDPDSDHVSETSDEETETHCDGDSLTGCLNGDHEDVGTIFFFWDI